MFFESNDKKWLDLLRTYLPLLSWSLVDFLFGVLVLVKLRQAFILIHIFNVVPSDKRCDCSDVGNVAIKQTTEASNLLFFFFHLRLEKYSVFLVIPD